MTIKYKFQDDPRDFIIKELCKLTKNMLTEPMPMNHPKIMQKYPSYIDCRMSWILYRYECYMDIQTRYLLEEMKAEILSEMPTKNTPYVIATIKHTDYESSTNLLYLKTDSVVKDAYKWAESVVFIVLDQPEVETTRNYLFGLSCYTNQNDWTIMVSVKNLFQKLFVENAKIYVYNLVSFTSYIRYIYYKS